MGIIRVILALSVVALHCGPILGFNIVGGTIAVQLFYIISGFYMCMILTEKYYNKSNFLFYSNRAMKIYPVYLVILVFTIILSIVIALVYNNDIFIRNFKSILIFSRLDLLILAILTNLFILGQDILFILGYSMETNTWFFEPNYITSINPLHHYLFVGQAWTISLELMFYLLAPFLVKLNNTKILFLLSISIGLRLVSYSYGYNQKPWDYQFFPFEIAFFLTGMLSYRFLSKQLVIFKVVKIQLTVFFLVLLSILFYPLSHSGEYLKWSFYLVFALALPFIFELFKTSRLDRRIGELSYPIYITHILVATLIINLCDFEGLKGFVVAIGSVLFSMVINKYIQNPIEIFRQNRVKNENSN
jgi:peptidoglycan/LPS O-acetylase OafA/YrhL